VEAINKALSSFLPDYLHIVPTHGPERVGDIRHSMANIERIQNTLDWKPIVGFEEGIKGLVEERLSLK